MNYKHGRYKKQKCIKRGCNRIREGKGYCRKHFLELRKNNSKINSMYIDGRTNKQYYCRTCGNIISWQTWYYGKKRCQKCFQKGKLNPRFGKHWTKEQNKKRSKILHKHHIDCNHFNEQENNIIYLTQSGHMKAHGSINKLIVPLIKKRIIYFSIKNGIYKLKKEQ